jgi:hypothetical protein
MPRVFMIVVAGGLAALGACFVYLGAFPPNPAPHSIEKVLPNDSFRAR